MITIDFRYDDDAAMMRRLETEELFIVTDYTPHETGTRVTVDVSPETMAETDNLEDTVTAALNLLGIVDWMIQEG